MASKVSFQRLDSYDEEKVYSAVKQIFDDFGGIAKLLEKGKKVVIKPNLVVKKNPNGCATTHPSVLEAVIRLLKAENAEITVAECPGGPNTPALLHGIYKETGILAVLEKYGISYASEMKPISVAVKDPLVCPQIDILADFINADVFINLAKMKTHSLTLHTGAAKNLYGTIPGMRKIEYHARFPEIESFSGLIIDINKAIKPDFSITDGVWGMEKDGPSGGDPKFAGALMGSDDSYALDVASCDYMGLNYKDAPILARAEKEGLYTGYEIIGDDFEASKPSPFILPDSKKPNILRSLPTIFGGKFGRFLSPHPGIDKNICKGCGECARLCPQKTISIVNGKAKINEKNCIRCWCCQEMCPHKAVYTKGKFFLHA